jgi:hypothetical protein
MESDASITRRCGTIARQVVVSLYSRLSFLLSCSCRRAGGSVRSGGVSCGSAEGKRGVLTIIVTARRPLELDEAALQHFVKSFYIQLPNQQDLLHGHTQEEESSIDNASIQWQWKPLVFQLPSSKHCATRRLEPFDNPVQKPTCCVDRCSSVASWYETPCRVVRLDSIRDLGLTHVVLLGTDSAHNTLCINETLKTTTRLHGI